jgi:hypothetical protein
MFKIFLIIFLVSQTFALSSQTPLSTRIYKSDIKTLQAGIKDQKFLLPIIELNGSDLLEFSFDQMSHDSRTYRYKVIHLNADRTPSELMSNEYLSGFTNADITDYTLSVNTTYLYTHYRFYLPNENMSFKISGNYAVIIYQDNKPEDPVAVACFSIVEPKVGISASVRGNTDTELNGRLQQIDMEVALKGYKVRDPNTEIKVVVRQNNRLDNEVSGLKPTFLSGDKLSYANNRQLIFEGGNEYHRFDISSVYSASEGIEDVKYVQPHYEVFLTPDKVNTSKTYMHNFDVNGKFLINFQESFENVHTEADYMLVHFRVPVQQPFFDGQIYLGGEFNYNQMNDYSKMQYDSKNEMYYKSVLLKQGGYNYQYWFVPKGARKASVEKIDGSYWQTRNEYTIYVFHRGWGERYDRLIGVKQVE